MQFHLKAGNIITNLEVKIYFNLPEFSATEILMWNCHVYDSAKIRYFIVSGRYLLTVLVLNLTFYEQIIKGYDGPFKS